MKKEFNEFLDSTKSTLKEEVKSMKEKFVIKKFEIGLEPLARQKCRNKTFGLIDVAYARSILSKHVIAVYLVSLLHIPFIL